MKYTLVVDDDLTVAAWNAAAGRGEGYSPNVDTSLVEAEGILLLNTQPIIIKKTLKFKYQGRTQKVWRVDQNAANHREAQEKSGCCRP